MEIRENEEIKNNKTQVLDFVYSLLQLDAIDYTLSHNNNNTQAVWVVNSPLCPYGDQLKKASMHMFDRYNATP